MSVICHNFVQNAWKKDLCSNCFKFVGDHKRAAMIGPAPAVQQNGSSPAHPPSNGHHEAAVTATPHTTWKNLIAEKNSKNNNNSSSFFKLENGFQGRLLTIHKALNGTESSSKPQKQQRATSEEKRTIRTTTSNGEQKKQPSQGNGPSSTARTKDGQKINGTSNDRNNTGAEPNSSSPAERDPPKRDEAPPLQGILKKKPSESKKSSSSSVGFKEEEPLVIGYGGRDFSPEELEEEEAASSSSSDEGGCDSLNDSETEEEDEDRASFSKMTRKNTEFNSDTSNLGASSASTVARQEAPAAAASPSSSCREADQESAKRTTLLTEGGDGGGSEKASREEEEKDSSASDRKEVAGVKNSSESLASPPLPVSSSISVGGDARSGKMFSDRDEGGIAWREEEDEESGTQDDGPADILQAINTSLTERHATMRGTHPEEEEEDKGNDGQTTITPTTTTSDNDGEEEACVEPRESFLHGRAIYGPASDLFVPRSNSSSSSSSDEQGGGKGRGGGGISLSIRVNGTSLQHRQQAGDDSREEDEDEKDNFSNPLSPGGGGNCETDRRRRTSHSKTKPEIPAKPSKRNPPSKCDGGEDGKTPEDDATKDEETISYYSPVHLVDPYAESNIYQEVMNLEAERGGGTKMESKLAALAMELEQARHVGGGLATKRQAPAPPPPKVPDPPQEDPPSCSSPSQGGFSTFRGESSAGLFSSASSTTSSSSSQDTEAGYASWNLHGEEEEEDDNHRRHRAKHLFGGKSSSSFLLQQYSRCKMLAMDRKKFSIKKLLKIGKDSPSDPADSSKAWKCQESRPRARLEIIHPMDLETKSVTVNPGFEGGSSSFSPASSSDYGSYYSDTLSPCGQERVKHESNYDYIQPPPAAAEEHEESKAGTSNSTSPTPSRSSTVSQASTVTSGSSKNEAVSSHRPPKPPPPPRAHSLLPGNKVSRNSDGTFRIPSVNGDTSSSDEVTAVLTKPQAPKRQCKSALVRTDYTNYEDPKDLKEEDNLCDQEEGTSTVQISLNESAVNQENAINNAFTKNSLSRLAEEAANNNEDVVEIGESAEGVYDNLEPANIQASITVKTGPLYPSDKFPKSILLRSKHPPLTKTPARPIYSKPQPGNFPKHPWKTLEDTYLALTSSNRELLIKLVNQALKRREKFSSKLIRFPFHWADFEMDVSQPSSVFAFGEKIAYHATMPKHPEYSLTLVISIQQQTHVQEASETKYPLFGKFNDCIPSELLDSSGGDAELESMPATVLVMDRSNVLTIEYFSESLPESLPEESEKELCFVALQLIQSLKSLQVQGIESIDTHCQNLLLAKTPNDRYHTLVFSYDSCYEEAADYASESCKVSLCQYTLMLLSQMLKIRDDSSLLSPTKFSSAMSRKVFETAFSLLSEEKAVSLSQTKTLFECHLWGVTGVLENVQRSDDCDAVLQRWLDVERSNCVKTLVSEEGAGDMNVQNEYHSQFLVRASVRNIREVVSYLLGD